MEPKEPVKAASQAVGGTDESRHRYVAFKYQHHEEQQQKVPTKIVPVAPLKAKKKILSFHQFV